MVRSRLSGETVKDVKVGDVIEYTHLADNGTGLSMRGVVALIEQKIGDSVYVKDSEGVALLRTDALGNIIEEGVHFLVKS